MKNYYAELSADKDGMLLYKGLYVVYVTHPSELYQGFHENMDLGRGYYNSRQRKRHLAKSLEGKSLCNMNVQMGEKKIDGDSPMQYVREPALGAGETCKVCYTNSNSTPSEPKEEK